RRPRRSAARRGRSRSTGGSGRSHPARARRRGRYRSRQRRRDRAEPRWRHCPWLPPYSCWSASPLTVESDRTYIDGINMTRLTTRDVADRLGVKPQTVYAYVSRGLLSSRRGPGGRASTFDAAEVEELARRRQRPGADAVRTGITLIAEDGRYYYRGVDATELASRYSYEEVADWLWTGRLTSGVRFSAPPD